MHDEVGHRGFFNAASADNGNVRSADLELHGFPEALRCAGSIRKLPDNELSGFIDKRYDSHLRYDYGNGLCNVFYLVAERLDVSAHEMQEYYK
jgi:hypothetical protein